MKDMKILHSMVLNTQGQISLLRGISKSLQRLPKYVGRQSCGGCGRGMGVSHTSKLGTFFLRSLALSMPTYSNF